MATIRLLSLIWCSLLVRTVLGAPCCVSGGSGVPLLLGDESQVYNLSLSRGLLFANKGSDSVVRKISDDDYENTWAVELGIQSVFAEKFQWGLSLPFSYRQIQTTPLQNQGSGWGDLATVIGYELVPEQSQNAYLPQILFYWNTKIPFGKSIHDSTEILNADAFSQGFWSTGPGILWSYRWQNVQAVFQFDYQRGFEKSFSASGITLAPGHLAHFSVSLNKSFEFKVPVIFGISYSLAATEGRKISVGSLETHSDPTQSSSLGLRVSVPVSQQTTVSAVYSDAAFAIPQQMTALRRAFLLSYSFVVLR